MPKFSIITISYNCLDDLLLTYESLLKQNLCLFEWILVDGLSNDISESLWSDFRKFARHIISEPDNGIADAWNKGIKLASGDFVLLLNAGETLCSGALSFVSNYCTDGNYIYPFPADIVSDRTHAIVKVFKPRPKLLPFGMYIPHNFTFVPLSFYHRSDYTNIKYSMDYEWFIRNYSSIKDSFCVIPSSSIGSYKLGGLSDKFALNGFYTNFRLQIRYLPKYYIPFLVVNFLRLFISHRLFRLLR